MLAYQETYIENTRRIRELGNLFGAPEEDFDAWFARQKERMENMRALRAENIRILENDLFPAIDTLSSADEKTLQELTEFAGQLMDWRTNLDCGVYVAIHEAMLRLYRLRKDREKVIRELYLLGMGRYYLRRAVEGIDLSWSGIFFQNELLFTEAASYIRYFEEMESEETKGYIIRALANISICTRDRKKQIGASARALQIVQDEHYRALAPGLPWDVFLRKTHQQMSSCRHELSRGDLTAQELATVLDSCYEVFRPEEGAKNPSNRWLWPYYEMEYNCGYADLSTTLDRMEQLIRATPEDAYDESGLYGNVQLPVYYSRLLTANPAQLEDPLRRSFMDQAYRKMRRCMLHLPAENFDDYFVFLIDFVITEFREVPGGLSYAEMMTDLMQRFAGGLYIRSRKAGDMMAAMARTILSGDGTFFDDIPFIAAVKDEEEKKAAAVRFAASCGRYMDFGLSKMNMERTMQTRSLFDNEYQMYVLHTVSGYDDLKSRPSTARYADTALGHHRWYDGSDGTPDSYVRIDSPFRQVTDVAAVVSFLLEEYSGEMEGLLTAVMDSAGRRFSPMVTAALQDESLCAELERILKDDGKAYYRSIHASAFRTRTTPALQA